jgi:hypothetical protein
MMTPTARSTTLPRMANFLNSSSIAVSPAHPIEVLLVPAQAQAQMFEQGRPRIAASAGMSGR